MCVFVYVCEALRCGAVQPLLIHLLLLLLLLVLFLLLLLFFLTCQDSEKRTPLHAAAYLGDAEIIELLILSGGLCSVWPTQPHTHQYIYILGGGTL